MVGSKNKRGSGRCVLGVYDHSNNTQKEMIVLLKKTSNDLVFLRTRTIKDGHERGHLAVGEWKPLGHCFYINYY